MKITLKLFGKIFIAESLHPTIRMVQNNNFACAQLLLRNYQRANGIIGHTPTCIS